MKDLKNGPTEDNDWYGYREEYTTSQEEIALRLTKQLQLACNDGISNVLYVSHYFNRYSSDSSDIPAHYEINIKVKNSKYETRTRSVCKFGTRDSTFNYLSEWLENWCINKGIINGQTKSKILTITDTARHYGVHLKELKLILNRHGLISRCGSATSRAWNEYWCMYKNSVTRSKTVYWRLEKLDNIIQKNQPVYCYYGNTYEYKDILRHMGCKWDVDRKCWISQKKLDNIGVGVYVCELSSL